MQGVVHLNGQYMPAERAAISPFDRGFLFADGVYEVVRYYAGKPLAMAAHVDRMRQSLDGIELASPLAVEQLAAISDELIDRNRLPDATVYWQITRGPADRTHQFPTSPKPTVFAFARAAPPLGKADEPPAAMSAITFDEIRWARCGIKSVSLLANVLARQAAARADCHEAIFVRADGTVTEATARSVFAVIDGVLRSYPLDGSVLGSITRQLAIQFAREERIAVDESPFSLAQMLAAEEVIVAGTTTQVKAVGEVDGKRIGGGRVGPIAAKLYAAYCRHVERLCLTP